MAFIRCITQSCSQDQLCQDQVLEQDWQTYGKGKGFPYSLPSVGPGADPDAQAVSPQVTISHPSGGRGCHYFPPGLRLPSQSQSITAPWPVPCYTAW